MAENTGNPDGYGTKEMRLARSRPMVVMCITNGSSIVWSLRQHHFTASECLQREREPSTPSASRKSWS